MDQEERQCECGKCLYMFMSVAERDRHYKVMHRDAEGKPMKTNGEHKCFFIIKANKCARRCNLTFKSRYELAAHKKLLGHLRGKKRKHIEVEPGQRSILNMLAHQEEEEDDGHPCKAGPGGDDNTCPRCQGTYKPGSGDWLNCSVCHFWYHEDCF